MTATKVRFSCGLEVELGSIVGCGVGESEGVGASFEVGVGLGLGEGVDGKLAVGLGAGD